MIISYVCPKVHSILAENNYYSAIKCLRWGDVGVVVDEHVGVEAKFSWWLKLISNKTRLVEE